MLISYILFKYLLISLQWSIKQWLVTFYDFIFLMTGKVYFHNRLRNTRERVGLKPTLSIPTNPHPPPQPLIPLGLRTEQQSGKTAVDVGDQLSLEMEAPAARQE